MTKENFNLPLEIGNKMAKTTAREISPSSLAQKNEHLSSDDEFVIADEVESEVLESEGDEDIFANEQYVGKFGKEKKLNRRTQVEQREGKQKYYTVLTAKFQPGDVIDGRANGWSVKKKQQIFLTNQPRPHYSIIDNADKMQRGIMYQVQPIGKVHYGSAWDELYTKRVKVLAVLGSTKGFYRRLQSEELKHQSDKSLAMKKNTSAVRAFGGKYYLREKEWEQPPSLRNDTSAGEQLLLKIKKLFG